MNVHYKKKRCDIIIVHPYIFYFMWIRTVLHSFLILGVDDPRLGVAYVASLIFFGVVVGLFLSN